MAVAPLTETFVFLFHCCAPGSCSGRWSPLGGAVYLQDRVDRVPLGTSSAARNHSSTVHRAVTSGAWRGFAVGSSGPTSSWRFCSGLPAPVKRFSRGSLKNQSDLVLKVRLVGGGRGGTRGPHRRRFCRRVMGLWWRFSGESAGFIGMSKNREVSRGSG